MPTVSQLCRSPRRDPRRRSDAPALEGCPQKRGVVQRIFIVKPKKPNSAQRACCRVKLTTGKEVTCFIPGDGNAALVREFAVVLVKGGGPPDLPGIKYKIVIGALDTKGGAKHGTQDQVRRTQSRSLYGVKLAR